MSDFTPGSTYIHFTKYGGINKGIVKRVGETIKWDTDNMVAYHIPYIETTVGHIIHLDGTDGRAFKIKGDITEEMLRRLKSSSTILEELKNRKEEHKKKTFTIFEQRAEEAREKLKNSNAEEVLKNYDNESNIFGH